MRPKRTPARKPATIANSRWLAYATAGASSAIACGLSNSAEGTIHYSGPIDRVINRNVRATFGLDQRGDFFWLSRYAGTFPEYYGAFGVRGLAGASMVGFYVFSQAYASKLERGQRVSSGPCVPAPRAILLGQFSAQFDEKGIGFIGFKFNNGGGDQYGWVRIETRPRLDVHKFAILDYAYGDVGDRVRAGQTSSNDMVPKKGSLGALALGAAGLLAWRKRRSRDARQATTRA